MYIPTKSSSPHDKRAAHLRRAPLRKPNSPKNNLHGINSHPERPLPDIAIERHEQRNSREDGAGHHKHPSLVESPTAALSLQNIAKRANGEKPLPFGDLRSETQLANSKGFPTNLLA